MNKLIAFASEIRVGALLCSSVTVLLTACGGGSADKQASSQTGQQNQLAATMVSSSGSSAQQETLQASTSQLAAAAPQDGTAVAAPVEATAADFTLIGHDGNTADQAAIVDPSAPSLAGAMTAAAPQARTSLLAAAASTAVAAATATTNNYYVATSGSDSNPGTQAKPFKTIGKASSVAKPSTTVFVAPGTYAGGFQTTTSGSATGRIYFVSTTKWGAKIVPPASSSNSTAWDNRGNYVSITGFDIDGSSSQSGTKWLHGIYTGGSYGVIDNNHVHNLATAVTCTSAGGSAIGVDSYYHGVMTDVIGNLVHDVGPAGCAYIQGIYFSTSGSIQNNVVYRIGQAAIHLWHDATNVTIVNNTVAASGFGIIVGGGDFYFTSAGADNTEVYNNIVFDNKYGISEQGKTGTHNTYRNNLAYQNASYNISLQNGLTATGTVSSAPLFVSYNKTSGTPDLHIISTSPAIGRGTATFAPTTDFDGRPRNASTGFDIGAYQH